MKSTPLVTCWLTSARASRGFSAYACWPVNHCRVVCTGMILSKGARSAMTAAPASDSQPYLRHRPPDRPASRTASQNNATPSKSGTSAITQTRERPPKICIGEIPPPSKPVSDRPLTNIVGPSISPAAICSRQARFESETFRLRMVVTPCAR